MCESCVLVGREWEGEREGVEGERKEGEKDLRRPGYTNGSNFLLPVTLCSFTERRLELTGHLAWEGGPSPWGQGGTRREKD